MEKNWQAAAFDDAGKKAKFLALMGARHATSSSPSHSSDSSAPYDPFSDTSEAQSTSHPASVAERERELAATYAAAATHTKGTGLGLT